MVRRRSAVAAAGLFFAIALLSGGSVRAEAAAAGNGPEIEVHPPVFSGALRNPLMGLTGRSLKVPEWATLTHDYIPWSDLDPAGGADVDKARAYFKQRWRNLPAQNVKVIPRVFLNFPNMAENRWPSDMEEGDFSSDTFKLRFARFVQVLGELWDNDPRVAFVELGVFGKWGEHHSPEPTAELQALAAREFTKAFRNKLVSVRHAWVQFQGARFGEYWDSFGHYDQMWTHGRSIAVLNAADGRYLATYIGGEVAYDWGNSKIEPGSDPTTTMRTASHRQHMINTIRWLHCTQLGWLADYDPADTEAARGAIEVQKAFGYRFEITAARFSPSVPAGGTLSLTMYVKNSGSAPFYYRWPVRIALLSRKDLKPVWTAEWKSVDVRKWVPGDYWPEPRWRLAPDGSFHAGSADWESGASWRQPPPIATETGSFLPKLPSGQYVLAVALCDPAGGRPAVHLASGVHLPGGWHALGIVGVGAPGGRLPADLVGVDPNEDRLSYDPE